MYWYNTKPSSFKMLKCTVNKFGDANVFHFVSLHNLIFKEFFTRQHRSFTVINSIISVSQYNSSLYPVLLLSNSDSLSKLSGFVLITILELTFLVVVFDNQTHSHFNLLNTTNNLLITTVLPFCSKHSTC